MLDAEAWIARLSLQEHPEGGYFREMYRSAETLPLEGLPERYSGPRSFSTSIYYLLKGEQCSAFHRLKSDELWHFYTGSALLVHCLEEAGRYTTIRLGAEVDRGESFLAVMKAGVWFGAEVEDKSSFSLVGCTVAPGFAFEDFELGSREVLLRWYPAQSEIIRQLTREDS